MFSVRAADARSSRWYTLGSLWISVITTFRTILILLTLRRGPGFPQPGAPRVSVTDGSPLLGLLIVGSLPVDKHYEPSVNHHLVITYPPSHIGFESRSMSQPRSTIHSPTFEASPSKTGGCTVRPYDLTSVYLDSPYNHGKSGYLSTLGS